MESAIKATLDDARKIEEQISAMLTALELNESIREANLISLPSNASTQRLADAQRKSNVIKNNMNVSDRKGKGKVIGPVTATASRIRKKSMEMDSAQIPMTEERSKFAGDGHRGAYELIESSLFLVPVMDEWVFGMTMVNSSEIAQNSPELILNLVPQKNVVDKPCKVFQYRVQVHPLDVKYDAMENRNVGDGIPYHDTFMPVSNSIRSRQVQTGCQVLVTATFQYPSKFLDKSNALNLIVSVMLDGTQLWSRMIPVIADNLAVLQQNENTFLLHQSSILTALGKHKEYFEMDRLLSQGEKSPHKAVEKFLSPLGFEKISSESVGIDSSIDIFACVKNHLSPLWGTTFKIKKCDRNANKIKCVFTSRSTQQFHIFMKLFQNWLKKEGHQERKTGLSGLCLLPIVSPTDDKNVFKTLQNEVNVISDLVALKQNNLFDKSNKSQSEKDSNWINEFMQVVCSSDDVFMNHLCAS